MMKIQSHITFWLTHSLLMLLGLISIAHAEPVILKGDNPSPIELAPHYQLHIDSQNKLSIDDILSPSNKIEFSPLADQGYKLEFNQEALWFRVNVTNSNPFDIKQLLEFNFPLLDDLGVYIVHQHSKRILARFDANDSQSFNSRLYQHSNFIFPVTLPAKSDLIFYFRIQSDRYLAAEATLWQPNAFAEQDRLTYFLICLYFGLLVSLIVYNLFLFILNHDSHYIYYALFASAMLLAVGSYQGIWFELFWPTQPHWQTMSIPISFAVAGLFAAFFSRSFLQTKSDAPTLDKAFIYIGVAFAITLATSPFIASEMSMQIVALCALLFTLIAITTAIILSIRGSLQGRLYLISWLAFLVGIALFSAQALAWLPNNIWTHNSIIYGSALEMIVLFFTLAQKITLLNNENNITRQEIFKTKNQLLDTLRTNDRELFQLVKKRTTTLEKANEYLLSQHGKTHDTLTGLANADLANEQLRLLLAECKRKDSKLVVLLLNLNNFKEVNTKFGHEIGDKLLINIAAKIRDNLRESDVAARTAGDEFIILLEVSDTDKDPAMISRKLKKAIDQTTLIDGYAIQVAVSIGIAIYPDNGDDVEDLLSKATQAMYIDKGYVKSSIKAVTPP
jgi:diguanylate cyclase (GGDEF)-like protein